MKTRNVRRLEVSPIGMGCMGLSHGYGEVPEKDYSIEAIRKAYKKVAHFSIQQKFMVKRCFTLVIMKKL